MNPLPIVHVIYGPQGAGKTTYARTLTTQTQGVRFSIDEWMVTLYGPDLPQPLDIAWVMARVARCHTQIWTVVQQLVTVHTPVILDLGFLTTDDRERARQLAIHCGAAPTFHLIDAPADLRRSRVLHRNEIQGETFALTVTPAMFDMMERVYQPPTASELAEALHGTSAHV
ncbi:AAA family ATPase [Deinococcus aquatilis]|uniref:AAA family ATPase n=1 Tax=Deinococcus aquatilis TaxID=519440 RepID=UPI0003688982|nr:ATP-binding protein [Deinococcus aquatilis]